MVLEIYSGPGTESLRSQMYTVSVSSTNYAPSAAYVYGITEQQLSVWNLWSGLNTYDNYVTLTAHMLTYGSDEQTKVTIGKIGQNISSIYIRPNSKNYQYEIVNGSANVYLKALDKAWITVNNEASSPLFIFCDPPKPPIPTAPQKFSYFGPGVHYLSALPGCDPVVVSGIPVSGLFSGITFSKTFNGIMFSSLSGYEEGSEYTIYVDGGAYVVGSFNFVNKNNIKLIGPGILSMENCPPYRTHVGELFSGPPEKRYVPEYASGPFNVTWLEAALYSPTGSHNPAALAAGKSMFNFGSITTAANYFSEGVIRGLPVPSGIVVSGITLVRHGEWGFGGNELINVKHINPWYWQGGMFLVADKAKKALSVKDSFFFICDDLIAPINLPSNSRKGFILTTDPEVFGIIDPDFGGEQLYENLQVYSICSPINLGYYERFNDFIDGGTYPITIRNIDAGCYRNLFSPGAPGVDFRIGDDRLSSENTWPLINLRTYNNETSRVIEDAFPYLMGSFGTYNITLSSINVEDPIENQLFIIGNFNLPASFDPNGYFPVGADPGAGGNSEFESRGPYGSISGILIADIDVSSSRKTPNMSRANLLVAASLQDKPSNITFKNIKIDGNYLTEDNYRNYIQLSGPITLEANNISIISPEDDIDFEVIGMDDVTKSPLERFTCTTNDGVFIYAGSESVSGNGHVWKYSPTEGWIRITSNIDNSLIKSFSTIKYNDSKLYVGSQGSSVAYGTGQIYVNDGQGDGWQNPAFLAVGNVNVALRSILFKNNDLYTAGSYFDVWKYSSNGVWSEVFGYAANFLSPLGPSSVVTHDLETDGTNIYAAMTTLLVSAVVMKYDGTSWTKISPFSFGNQHNTSISKLKWHNNKLYAATFNLTTGTEIWEYNGSTWQQIGFGGLGAPSNFQVVSMESIGNKLVVSIEGISGGKLKSYTEDDGWLDIPVNSDVVYASYFIERVGDKNYLIGTKRKNFITKTEPYVFITSQMKNSASAYYFPDGNIGLIPLENNKYRFIGPNSIWQFVSDGPLDNPFETPRSSLVYSDYLNVVVPSNNGFTRGTDILQKKNDFTYFNTAATATLQLPNVRYNSGGLIHKIPNTSTVIAFVHAEEGFWDEGSTGPIFVGTYFNSMIRQAVSFDNGITFYDCGKVIDSRYPARPNTSTSAFGTGLGLGGYAIRDGYIYLYYTGDNQSNVTGTFNQTALAIARAPYSEFAASATNKNVCSWNKFYNGSFSEPGINGNATNLLNYNVGYGAGWSVGINSQTLDNVCFFISIPTYYKDLNDVQSVYIPSPTPGVIYWRNQSYVTLSEDNLNWGFPEKISSFDNSCIYTTPLSVVGYLGELDDEFRVLGHRSAFWTESDQAGGIVTKQQLVEVQPFRDVERGFSEGTYFNPTFKIFTKQDNEWTEILPFTKINNQWKLSYPQLRLDDNWIESSPLRQGKEEVDLYFYIGDSIAADAAGSAIDLLTYSDYSGLYSSVPGCHLFRVVECPQTTGEFGAFTEPRFEEYRTGVNTNSVFASAFGYMGADIVLFDKLKKSSNNDVYVLKSALGGSRFVKEAGYFDWSPRSQNEDFGDLFKIYYDTHVVPGLNWLRNNNKNPIFKGGFITLGTNIPTYIGKQEFTKEQINLDSSGLVSGLIDLLKSNGINTDIAKIIWILPDRARLFSNPGIVFEPFRSDYIEYFNAVVSSVQNLSSIFNFVSSYDPSAWASLSTVGDYYHPATSGHVKVAERVFDRFFATSVPSYLEVHEGPGTEALRSSAFSVKVGLPIESEFYPTYVYSATERAAIFWDSTQPVFELGTNKFWMNGSYPVMNCVSFGSKGKCVAKITDLNNSVSSYELRPKSKNYQVSNVGGSLFIEMNPFDKAWFIINNQTSSQLFVFCDPLKPEIPTERCTYFGPGIHYVGSDYTVTGTIIRPGELPVSTPYTKTYRSWFNIFDGYVEGQDYTLYLDGGSIVNGYLDLSGRNNIKVIGPGILSGLQSYYDLTPQSLNPDDIQQINESAWNQYPDVSYRHNSVQTLRGLARDRGPVGFTPSGVVVSGITIINPSFMAVESANTIDNIKVINPWKFQGNAYPMADKSTRKAILQRSFMFLNEDSTFPFMHTHNTRDLPEFAGGIDFSDDGKFGGEVIVSSCQMYTVHGSPLNITYYASISASSNPKTYPILVTDLDIGCYSKTIGFSSVPEFQYYANPSVEDGVPFSRRSWPLIRLITSTWDYALPYLNYFGTYDITVSNIRVEDPIRSNALYLGNFLIAKQFLAPYIASAFGSHNPDNNQGTISGITFADISISSEPGTEACSGLNQIWAYDAVSKPFNITFKNFKINNTYVTSSNYTNYFVLSSTTGYNPNLARDNIVFVTGTS